MSRKFSPVCLVFNHLFTLKLNFPFEEINAKNGKNLSFRTSLLRVIIHIHSTTDWNFKKLLGWTVFFKKTQLQSAYDILQMESLFEGFRMAEFC